MLHLQHTKFKNELNVSLIVEHGTKRLGGRVNTGRQGRPINLVDPLSEPAVERKALDEESFRRVIAIERKRTERSKAPFVLMLVEIANQNTAKTTPALETVMSSLLTASRDTDVV